jgi:proteasome accessory factor B
MYTIDEQLRSRRYPNCSSLARHFEVSSKTIQRDIAYMQVMLGAPITYDQKRRGFHYESEWRFLPSTFLDERETRALMATKKVLANYTGTPYYDEVSRALDKVLQALPETLPEHYFFDVCSFARPTSEQPDPRCFARLEDAIRHHIKVNIRYEANTTGQLTERTVHPYRLHYAKDTWYLIGFCELRGAIRAFVLRRMKQLDLLDGKFAADPSFNPDEYIDRMFNSIMGNEEEKVRIRFSARQAPWMRERRWHPSQEIVELGDGSIDLLLTVSSLDAVRSWVLQYGVDAEVIEPGVLRDMVMNESLAIAGMYGGVDKPSTPPGTP